MVLVRRMAELANDAGLGLLHGRDLAVRSFAEWDRALLSRRRPVGQRSAPDRR